MSVYLSIKLFQELHIVMELCDSSVEDLLKRSDGPMDTTATLVFIEQMQDALKYLYDERIIHRDIKPGNILVSTGNILVSNITYKLCDFGVVNMHPYFHTISARHPVLCGLISGQRSFNDNEEHERDCDNVNGWKLQIHVPSNEAQSFFKSQVFQVFSQSGCLEHWRSNIGVVHRLEGRGEFGRGY